MFSFIAKRSTWRQFRALILIEVLCVAVVAIADGDSAPRLTVDYESGTLSSGVYGLGADAPKAADALTVDCTVARSGRCSLRTKLIRADDYVTFRKHRAEADTLKIGGTHYSSGETVRYQFSLMLAEGWEIDAPESVDIVWQFKRYGPAPDMFVGIKGRDAVLRLGATKQAVIVKGFPVGNWVDIRLDVTWSPSKEGNVSVFVRIPPNTVFERIVDLPGPTMLDARPASAFLKWGGYKPGYERTATRGPRILYHDDIMVQRLR